VLLAVEGTDAVVVVVAAADRVVVPAALVEAPAWPPPHPATARASALSAANESPLAKSVGIRARVSLTEKL
jgi:hypothetical protein